MVCTTSPHFSWLMKVKKVTLKSLWMGTKSAEPLGRTGTMWLTINKPHAVDWLIWWKVDLLSLHCVLYLFSPKNNNNKQQYSWQVQNCICLSYCWFDRLHIACGSGRCQIQYSWQHSLSVTHRRWCVCGLCGGHRWHSSGGLWPLLLPWIHRVQALKHPSHQSS